MKCRFCQSSCECFLDLGFAPSANAYLKQGELSKSEAYFPLRINVCKNCWLVQTQDYISPDHLFSEEYAYFSSTSSHWLEHAKSYVEMIIKECQLTSSSLVIEVGANDGYLLKNFLNSKIPCIGIDPSLSTSRAAREKGIDMVEDFFNLDLAKSLPKADLVIGNNVYAHVPDIKDFTQSIKQVLKKDGVVTLEFPHLLKLINEVQFDTIYHEHFSYLSLYTVDRIFASCGLKIFDVEEISTHGGSLRIYGCHAESTRKCSSNVSAIIENEDQVGLRDLDTYRSFSEKAFKIRNKFLSFLLSANEQGKKVVAYGAAAKGNTLLNFAGVKPDLVKIVYDAAESKQGKYLPGSHIPIRHPEALRDEEFDYIIVLPWNIQSEIKKLLHSNYGVPFEKMISFWPCSKGAEDSVSLKRDKKESIPVFKPLIESQEIAAAVKSLEIGWLGMGASVNDFERSLQQIVGKDRHVVAVSTGHAALHLAMLLIGLQPGDEVITPSFNNIADFQAILAVGAKPVFCDVREDTLCIDVAKAERLITTKTKAIIPMDYGVFLADHDEVNHLAEKYNLRVIHDAAHSFGSSYKGRPVGSFSDLTMFSFDPVKNITCIDGGALIVKTEEEAKLVQKMRLVGMEQAPKIMYQNQRAWTYDVNHLGFRYHMANLHAAIGCAQFKKLDKISEHRRQICQLYDKLLAHCSDVICPNANYEQCTPFLYFIRVDASCRRELIAFLSQKNIDTGIHWQPGHLFSLFKNYTKGDLEVTNRIGNEIITLPLHSDIKEETVTYICTQIESFFSLKLSKAGLNLV